MSSISLAAPKTPTLRIKPSQGWVALQLGELWEYRELLYFMTWRDLKVRYKQTVLGAAWALLQPLMSMVVFSLFFGGLAKMPSDNVPYPIFSMAGLLPWTYFTYGLTQASMSLVSSSNLIRRVYFPRLIVPLSSIFSGALDFLIGFGLLLVMMFYYHIVPTMNIIWLPAFILMTMITSLGIGLWLCALNVRYRDVRYVIPFLTQFWMFATPIVYPSSLILAKSKQYGPLLHTIYGLNPMAGVVEGFRWALLGTDSAPGPLVAVSVVAALALLVSGAYYFRRMDRFFADAI